MLIYSNTIDSESEGWNNSMLFIETEQLVLRDFEVSDFDDVNDYSSDYENVRHTTTKTVTPAGW